MCSVSWRWEAGKPELWCSRDEQRCRPPALPPQTHENGVVCPLDPQGGGTWIFANRHGLIGVLLNGYTPAPPGPLRSRGLLLRDLSESERICDVAQQLKMILNANRTNTFYLLVLQDVARLWHWNGAVLREQEVGNPMISSSSVDTEAVLAIRHAHYLKSVQDPLHPTRKELDAFHAWQDPLRPHASVRMSRNDARTVSITKVHFAAGGFPVMQYTPLED